jgi:cytochrome c oxidase assembly factor CtaG
MSEKERHAFMEKVRNDKRERFLGARNVGWFVVGCIVGGVVVGLLAEMSADLSAHMVSFRVRSFGGWISRR